MSRAAKILVVEDEWIIANDIRTSLDGLGYSVTAIASSANEALEQVEQNRPDLVLMDIMLQGPSDGIEAAKIIGAQYNIPLIYVTANADAHTIDRARGTSPYAYLVKPFEDRELLATIEMVLHRHELQDKLRISEQKFRNLVESAGDAFFVLDEDGTITEINQVAHQSLGYERDELIGMHYSAISPDMSPRRYLEIFQEILQNGSMTIPSSHRRLNGSTFPVEIRVSGFESGDNQYLLALARDNSEHERLVSELKQALSNIQALKSAVPLCVLMRGIHSEQDISVSIRKHHDAILNNGVCQDCLSSIKQGFPT